MIELKLIPHFPREIIALDEVGRSPLSGPVVIGAVRLKVSDPIALTSLIRLLRRRGAKDSKGTTHEARMKTLSSLSMPLLPFREKGGVMLRGMEINYVTWEMHHDVIDSENILNASLRAMKEAALYLTEERQKALLFIDGHMKLRWGSEECPWEEIPIVKGDKKSALISLASIIAKEKRDAWMREMHLLYPHYNFESNMGYPTPEHRKAIALHGPCPIHRKSFNKVKEFIRP